ncbi:molybdate ABC transporter permease subunit, partial [Trinickia symbiotica]
MSASIWTPLLLSLKVAGWATVLNLVLGVGAAYALARTRSRLREVIDSVLTLPLVLPPTVLGYYLLVLLGRRGTIGGWLDSMGIQLVFTWQGAVIASTVVAFPLVMKS